MFNLTELFKDIAVQIYGNNTQLITGISYDSRTVVPGNIFFALPGVKDDGIKYVNAAIANGAVAIVCEDFISLPINICLVVVKPIRKVLAEVSRNFYFNPTQKLNLIGVTGTNGKTTVTYLCESIISAAGKQVGVIGTINYRWRGKVIPANTTTPESVDLLAMLSQMREDKVDTVVMEVSSHSLVQYRTAGCDFSAAVFTNLTRDHLDYHHTFEEYFQAKSILFQQLMQSKSLHRKYAILNIDDLYGKKIQSLLEHSDVRCITYGINQPDAELYATNLVLTDRNTKFTLHCANQEYEFELNLLGLHNVSNVIAAFAVAYTQQIPLPQIITALNNFAYVPGRLERVNAGQNYTVLVDYAHTDDALKNVLTLLTTIKQGKIITVFGCGGDRDRSKRPLMGKVATEMSDYVILTSDNPRTEDPEAIILDVEVGIHRAGKNNYERIIDRRQAIARAVSLAQPNDIVLLAGKGHETYQIIGQEKIPFDDRIVVQECISGFRQKVKDTLFD